MTAMGCRTRRLARTGNASEGAESWDTAFAPGGWATFLPVRCADSCKTAEILEPYVREGMTVLEPGPGMGFFTMEMARQVGPSGRVVAIDVQPRMIAGLKRRLAKAGLLERIDARVAPSESLALQDLQGKVDFALAMAVVHEMPSSGRFFAEVAQAMKPGATLLLAEPSGHVKKDTFEAELRDAAAAGLEVKDR